MPEPWDWQRIRARMRSCVVRPLTVLAAGAVCHTVLLGQGQDRVSPQILGAVVKITSKAPEGQDRTGTGFIVRVDRDLVYIATASHVVEGDAQPRVAFYHDQKRPATAEIGALEGGDPKGLAYLIVRDADIASKVIPLNWSSDRLSRGDDVVLIGFGQGLGEWGVVKGSVASFSGSELRIDGRVGEGNSGGPILRNGNVAGMVTQVSQGFGVGKSGVIAVATLAGWDIPVPLGPRGRSSASGDNSATDSEVGNSIVDALNGYRAAYERMDVTALLHVFPTFAGAKELERKFADLRGVAMALGTPEIRQSSPTRAVATCNHSLTFTSRAGKIEQTRPQLAEFALVKSSERWLIESVRFR